MVIVEIENLTTVCSTKSKTRLIKKTINVKISGSRERDWLLLGLLSQTDQRNTKQEVLGWYLEEFIFYSTMLWNYKSFLGVKHDFTSDRRTLDTETE